MYFGKWIEPYTMFSYFINNNNKDPICLKNYESFEGTW